mgnify:CR=1 FL=1
MADEKALSRLVFDLPDRRNQLGGLETNRLVSCECIQGQLAAEISSLWAAYRTGCAGLDPAAYRECVEALKQALSGYDTAGSVSTAIVQMREALAHAEALHA